MLIKGINEGFFLKKYQPFLSGKKISFVVEATKCKLLYQLTVAVDSILDDCTTHVFQIGLFDYGRYTVV